MSTSTNASSSASDSPKRAFETVLQHIESLILKGRLRVGDRLPAERDLALQLHVSRPAIREAIRTLEAQGVLASRVGSGANSGTHVINERSQALGRLLRLQVALSQFPLDEVVTTRIALERSSVQMAAQYREPEALAHINDLLDQMDAEVEIEHFNALDTEFHIALAQSSHNSLVADLTQAVRESLRAPILRAEREMNDWPSLRRRLAAEHRAITESIEAGNANEAADRMEQHIRTSYNILQLESSSCSVEADRE
ncbi:FadR/GntR family transcriptional regulator [Luteococcus sp. OSA5]|uniref:FadR/GntR family transcriptional regulator n=1 Tax=Luteococcus sp. OSA5 TaxID=3401630 RepID=UPI003B43CD60